MLGIQGQWEPNLAFTVGPRASSPPCPLLPPPALQGQDSRGFSHTLVVLGFPDV